MTNERTSLGDARICDDGSACLAPNCPCVTKKDMALGRCGPVGWFDPPEGPISRLGGRLQTWLQHRKSWHLIRLGNAISDLRYRHWRHQGGSHERW